MSWRARAQGTIFAINELTGDIHAMKRLDREEKAEYTLTAQVVNADTDEPLEPPSEFIIKVQDINDNPPQFIEGPYRAAIPEMSAVELVSSTPDFINVLAAPYLSSMYPPGIRNGPYSRMRYVTWAAEVTTFPVCGGA
ncbi:unnamed protein product [Pleuronectes platessa]|uniref:Cadherin domain-containing protein n=1 Tax=Pleuronectes platessa TaxID=8262 RepID=A0A9N7UIU5_PLEPL|nr:unnamed protein product [Pleuronectes platessa]